MFTNFIVKCGHYIVLFFALCITLSISDHPIYYSLGAAVMSILLYAISRFLGFFIKRNPEYYNDQYYIEDDV